MQFPLTLVQIDITSKCNLSCKYCRNSASERDEMSLSDWLLLADRLKEFGVRTLVLSGGEPFIFGGLAELVKKFWWVKHIIITSNGTILDRKVLEEIRDCKNVEVQISLDGDEKHHEEMRGKGNFERAIGGVRLLREFEIPIHLKSVITKFNVDDMRSVVGIANDLGVDKVFIRSVIPVGHADEHLMSDTAEYVRNFIDAKKFGDSVGVKVLSGDPFLLNHLIDKKFLSDESVVGGCLAGMSTLYFSFAGDIGVCSYLNKFYGNIKSDTLNSAFRRISDDFQNVKVKLTGKCGNCRIKHVCGGCRAMAYSISGNLFGEDPRAKFCEAKIWESI